MAAWAHGPHRSAGATMASVVVVEHDDVYLSLAERELRAAGHEVVGFADWIGVLELLESDHAVDAFVVCLRLPLGGPNAYSLAQMAQLRRPKLKVVYMTADPALAYDMRETMPNVLMPKRLASANAMCSCPISTMNKAAGARPI